MHVDQIYIYIDTQTYLQYYNFVGMSLEKNVEKGSWVGQSI